MTTAPQKTRTIIVGDVHGCYFELQDLLQEARYDSRCDRLILVGDLVMKGPHSDKVLCFVRDNNIEFVLGNNDLKFIAEAESKRPLELVQETLERLPGKKRDWLDWLKKQPLIIDSDDFVVVHAGFAPGIDPEDSPARILTTIRTWDGRGKNLSNQRNPAWYEFYEDKKLVVFGHWAQRGVVKGKNYIGLDSGCVYGKKLTALILPERRLVQVDARRVYEEIPRG